MCAGPGKRSRIELYSATRADSRAVLSNRETERKYGVGWRTVAAALPRRSRSAQTSIRSAGRHWIRTDR
ncbi:MAG: hypothetical protein JWN03_4107 [Nocardia sp.]|nr:hypothetical protein [Nocardia sp.]